MAGFWYPYSGPHEALARLGHFADATVGPGCGISFSDGHSIAVLRRPRAGTHAAWLNVLRRHAAVPRAVPPKPQGALQRLEHWFEQAMTMIGEGQMREAEANMAASRAVTGAIEQHVWQPAHQWLLKHKLIADGLGVAVDVVGVIAGVAFVVALAPEIGVLAIATGVSAAVGSVVLLGVDGAVFGAEITGHEDMAKAIEDNQVAQWARIVGTVMTLPDMAVGGVKALKEVGALAREERAATAAARVSTDASAAERARIGKIRNPEKHPHAVQRHRAKANKFARAAAEHAREANSAHRRMLKVAARDVGASYGATPAGAALITASPPSIALTDKQKQRDKHLLEMLAPEGGMPHDVKFEMRTSVLSRQAHH